jgi:16S rRNA (guanine966-N2)-methyltransferase
MTRSSLSSIRIIGGSLRGSKITVPHAPGLRPTPDRARETLFNWLQVKTPGARVLDWFAGTGALGIEAISRGAAFVDFVESDTVLAQKITDELSRLKVPNQANVHARLASSFTSAQPYDLVFLDPPFSMQSTRATCVCTEALAYLLKAKLLAANALVYVETDRPAVFQQTGFQLQKQARAGAVHFALLSAAPD